MLAPGVQADQGSAASGQTDSISFSGMGEQYKSIWLEGVDFNDEVTSGGSSLSDATRISIAQEVIQEFQVMTNSYSTEFGRSASGVINVVTKSGGNNFHGSGFYFLRDDSFDKKNFFAQSVPPFKIQQFGGTVGGPIRQDKAHFFASYERRKDEKSSQPAVSNLSPTFLNWVRSLGYDTASDVPVNTSIHNWFGKLSFVLHPSHTLNVSYLYDDRELPNQQVGGSNGADHGYNDVRTAYFVVGGLTSLLGSRTVNEFRVSRSIQKLNRETQGPTRPELVFPTISFGQASNVPQSRAQYNWVILDSVSRYFTGFLGQHNMKFGGQMNFIPTTSLINQSFNGQFTFASEVPVDPNNPATLPHTFRQGIELRGKLAALTRDINVHYWFVNDSWQVNRKLTVNLGIRHDYQSWRGDLNGQDLPADVPMDQFWLRLITGDLRGQNYKAVPSLKKNFSPRMGFSYDLFGTAKTVVRGGYGIYYDRINTTTLRSVVAGYPGFITSQISNDSRQAGRPRNDFFPNLPPAGTIGESAGTSFRIPNRDAAFPYTQQMTLGTQHTLAADYSVSADFVHIHGLHFDHTRNVNARLPNGSFPLVASGLVLNLLDNTNIIKINQLQLRLEKRFSNRLGFLLGYTIGDAKTESDTPTNNYDLHADWGPAPNDVRHRIVSNLIYDGPYGIQMGGVLTYNTASPYNITTGTDDNRDTVTNDRPAGVGWNSSRGDNLMTVDARFGKRFNFGESMSLQVTWEMYNLFNRVNFASFNGNMRSTTFGKPANALDPFQAQLGIKFTF